METFETPPEPRDRKGWILLAAVGVVALLVVFLAARERSGPATGSAAPELSLPLLGGGELALAEQRGKVVLLDFWATWCKPCVESMPAVDRVGRELAGRGVVTVAVNGDHVEKREELVRAFLSQHGLEGLTVALDDGKAAAAFGVQGLPTMIVLGRDGKVAATHLGVADEGEIRALVERALGEPPG